MLSLIYIPVFPVDMYALRNQFLSQSTFRDHCTTFSKLELQGHISCDHPFDCLVCFSFILLISCITLYKQGWTFVRKYWKLKHKWKFAMNKHRYILMPGIQLYVMCLWEQPCAQVVGLREKTFHKAQYTLLRALFNWDWQKPVWGGLYIVLHIILVFWSCVSH